MTYHVHVYITGGLVEVEIKDAKSQEDAMKKAITEVEHAEAGFHGNYPPSDRKYLAVIPDKSSKVTEV